MRTSKKLKIILTITIIFIIISYIASFYTNITYAEKDELQIYSNAVLLLENRTGKILYEKNANQKAYPASTTKILTGLIAVEKGNLEDKVTVSQTAVAEMKPGYTSAYLVAGEELTVQNLLEVLLVHSANDAANVLAEYISGSIEEFVKLMNKKLEEFGCTNSHFVTTNGLHDDNHYTTAKDMANIARHCMQNPTFRKIVAMKECVIPATNKCSERIYKNTNDLLIPTSSYYYPGCIGIKTGYTSEAQNCLVSACNKNDLQLIAIVFGASLTENHRSARYVDSKTLYDYGYGNFSFQTIEKANTTVEKIEVPYATDDTKNLEVYVQKDITALVHNNDTNSVKKDIKLRDNISAPISANSIVGEVSYTIGNDTYTANLLAKNDVYKKENIVTGISKTVKVLIIIIVILTLLLVLMKIYNRKK